jgi:hypothetical protein
VLGTLWVLSYVRSTRTYIFVLYVRVDTGVDRKAKVLKLLIPIERPHKVRPRNLEVLPVLPISKASLLGPLLPL